MPSDIDYCIADICPEDFEEDQNNYDSDGQVSFTHNKNFNFNIVSVSVISYISLPNFISIFF